METATATLFLLGLGLGAAGILAVASRIFYVWEDPKIQEVEDSLLGANCGGCGYPGCAAAAAAVVEGKEGAEICVAGGFEIAMKVAGVMGLEVEIKEPEIAYSSCRYNIHDADTRYNYAGVQDCRAAAMYGGGSKECPIGCLGLGTCFRACPFSAITMGEDGLPVFDRDRCRSCGVCVEVCPKNIIYLSSVTSRMIGDFRDDECSTPCQRACPTGIDIPGYIRQIAMGNHEEALRIIKERNPLPSIVGRICPAPCEMDCRRNHVDQSVAINDLKRFAADHERKAGKRIHPYMNPDTGIDVAVIGGGAQGLTTAYYLACLGHRPVVFEGRQKLGGIIRYVIPDSRLPEKIIDWDIAGILDAGVKTATGKVAGIDYTMNSLLSNGFKAVALATGGVDSEKLLKTRGGYNNTIPGVYILIEFLDRMMKDEKTDIGKKVYIVGGGTSTLEAARLCRESGASEITVICPFEKEDHEGRGIDTAAAESDGTRFLFSSVVNAISGEGEKLQGISITREDCSVENFDADTLIVATGRLSDLVFTGSDGEDEYRGRWTTVASYNMNPDNIYNDLFACNENGIMNDNLAVIRSIAMGRRIARAMHLHVSGKELVPPEHQIKKGMKILNTEVVHRVRPDMRKSPAAENVESYCDADVLYGDKEISAGFDRETAVREAERCLDCGLICYRKNVG